MELAVVGTATAVELVVAQFLVDDPKELIKDMLRKSEGVSRGRHAK